MKMNTFNDRCRLVVILTLLAGAWAPGQVLRAEPLEAKNLVTVIDRQDTARIVSYEDVLKLLKQGHGEDAILRLVAKSPTLFVLGAQQETELKRAGASAKLIEALKASQGGKWIGDVTDIAIILDCSGSMQEPTKEGKAKMAVARSVVADLVGSIPDGLRLTFITYGDDTGAECEKQVTVVRPLTVLDKSGKSELSSLILRLEPAGATPIAMALRAAGKELDKNDALCGIVLISDGKETCNGDPAAEAATLSKNLKLTFGVNVIGFDVSADERAALQAIATAGGGDYYDADSAAQLNQVKEQLKTKIEEVATTPEQRGKLVFDAHGKAIKPGSFFHDAPVVEAGEFKGGGLGFMDAHYYQISLRKGQELRAIGIVKKTPYQAMNKVVNQTFVIAIYDSSLMIADFAGVVVEGNPTAPVSFRAVWTAENDGIAYVAIAASDNQKGGSGAPISLYGDLNPKPSHYTLRLRLSGDGPGTDELAEALPRLEVKPGRGFEQAGKLTVPGLVATDLKLGEVIFYRFKVAKGDVVQVSLAAQKPWYNIMNWFGANDNKATYTLTLYDDDQVQVAGTRLVVNGNRPEANSASVTWPVELNGTAYVSVSVANSGNSIYPVNFDPKPGRLAIQVTHPLAAAGAGGR